MARGSVVEDERAVPRERAPLPADPAPARRAAVAARQPCAVYGWHCRRLVAAGRGRGGDRARGLLSGAADLQAGPDSRQPHAPAGVPKRHPRLHEGRDSGLEARHLPRVPDLERNRRPRRPRGEGLVPNGEVAGARGAVRRQGDEVQLHLVLGLGRMDDDARGTRPGEAESGVRLSLGEESESVQRPPRGR